MDGAGEHAEVGPGKEQGHAGGVPGAGGWGAGFEGTEAVFDGGNGMKDALDPASALGFVLLPVVDLKDGVAEGCRTGTVIEGMAVGGDDGGTAERGQEEESEEGPEGEGDEGGDELPEALDARAGKVGGEGESGGVPEHGGGKSAEACAGSENGGAAEQDGVELGWREGVDPMTGEDDGFEAGETGDAAGKARVEAIQADGWRLGSGVGGEAAGEFGKRQLEGDQEDLEGNEDAEGGPEARAAAGFEQKKGGSGHDGALNENAADPFHPEDGEHQAEAVIAAGEPIAAEEVEREVDEGVEAEESDESGPFGPEWTSVKGEERGRKLPQTHDERKENEGAHCGHAGPEAGSCVRHIRSRSLCGR